MSMFHWADALSGRGAIGFLEIGLMVLGGAALGGYSLGFLSQLLSRWLTTKPLPAPALHTIRVAAGMVCGWGVYMLASGTGGGGGFGLGGGGTGKGTGGTGNAGSTQPVLSTQKNGSVPSSSSPMLPDNLTSVTVRVLGKQAVEALQKAEGGSVVNPEKCLQLHGQSTLLTRDDLLTKLQEAKKRNPKLNLVVLQSDDMDGPAPVARFMVELRSAIERQGFASSMPGLSKD